MSAYENVKFSQLGYTFIFDDDFRCLYSDSNSMAERLKGCRSIRNAMIVNRGRCQPFEHRFSFGKVRYRAAFIPFFEFCYICRVYPEDCYMRCAYSELYKSIFDIRNVAAVSVSEIQRFEEDMFSNSDEDKYGTFASGEKERSDKMLSVASSLLKMFDAAHTVDYVPIIECVGNSCDAIRKVSPILHKNIEFEVDIRRSVARMNYVLFDAALSGIARLLYRCMYQGDTAHIRIAGKSNGMLEVSGFYESDKPLCDEIPQHDIGILKCIFECLAGRLSFIITEKKFIVNASVPAELSDYTNRIRNAEMYQQSEGEVEYDPLGFAGLFSTDHEKPISFSASKIPYSVNISTMMCNIAMQTFYEKYVS